ncbi:MAG: oxaloacetate decarboxylase alpha chain [Gammaproteobacteria bacterium]|nr:MAG: oxaloacetate decarboxylase alpha chain [Gammaproteobacteria bacterium]
MPKAYLNLGDILKSEADPQCRVAVPADPDTKAGTFVDYPLRDQKVVALTDEVNGEVLIQPHNCVIDLQYIAGANIAAAGFATVEDLKIEGDAHGIVYINAPDGPVPNIEG